MGQRPCGVSYSMFNERKFGNKGESILLIPGWMHSAKMYEKLALALSTSFTVYVIDLPGFGESRNMTVNAEYPLECLAKQLSYYITQNHFDLIFAHSLAANIMLRISTPSETKVILCSPVYGGIHLLRNVVKNKFVLFSLLSLKDTLPIKFATQVVKLLALATVNRIALIDDVLIESSIRANTGPASNILHSLVTDNYSVKPRSNVVVIWGDKDRLIQWKNVIALCIALKCDFILLRGIGHSPFIEYFEGLLSIINSLL
jgi:pimeloyl-ACP methyl ester carboxylesterase